MPANKPRRPLSLDARQRCGNARITRAEDTELQPTAETRMLAASLGSLVAAGTSVGLVVPSSIEGILTGVGAVYLAKAARTPVALHIAGACQPGLDETVLDLHEDEPFARRVLAGFERAVTSVDTKRVIYACLSDDPQRGRAVLTFMRRGFDLRKPLCHHQTEPQVAPVFDLSRAVSCECERARQFVRFHRMENGIYRARFEPRANVVPLVMGHFTARFNIQPFMIHDPLHGVVGFWDGTTTQLVQTDAPGWGYDTYGNGDDAYYQALWKRFYDCVAIESRTNPNLRRQLMPKRFWKNLPEMSPLIDTDAPPRHWSGSAQALGASRDGGGAPGE